MKAGSVLVNVSRGEIVDEGALADALQRDHLRGAALDVYDGEFERVPIPRLWSDSRVLITPHISAASDQDRHGAIDLFCGICAPILMACRSETLSIGNGAISPSDEQRLDFLARQALKGLVDAAAGDRCSRQADPTVDHPP
jgi:hypothetical protein